MSHDVPGADEKRARHYLLQHGVGPDASTDDWWDRLYADRGDAGRPDTGHRPDTRPRTIGGGRLPDWRHGEQLDLKPEPPPAEPDVPTADADEPAATDDAEAPEPELPNWDPLRIADRIVQAQRARPPVGERARRLVTTVQAKPRAGQLLYGVTGIAAAWHIGLTPWLLEHTDDAPLGISVVLCLIGWAIHRRTAQTVLPVAWAGHAVWTSTVISLFLHP
ncbi:hypothetical protein [Streptomyces boncukensis]|uniref:Uncharacterized protein n=1 Tax=Streptomyces boncukensis TaxID=2711219 RepID=A0A6G4WUL5_9ACTN|nr:hypothetical protein [Streptomyces boncukensis]NGO68542.1 hypothetical protein [Streptomyces boncukensis]